MLERHERDGDREKLSICTKAHVEIKEGEMTRKYRCRVVRTGAHLRGPTQCADALVPGARRLLMQGLPSPCLGAQLSEFSEKLDS